ncbi:MAG: ABC transporter permease [Chloroflexota bacterium]
MDETIQIEDASAAIEEPSLAIEEPSAAITSPQPGRLRRFATYLRRVAGGSAAVTLKELRGRMRGRRVFVIITVYLLLLAGFTWLLDSLLEQSYANGFGNVGTFAAASIGQQLFIALLMLETIVVAFLAPAATAGSISLEREKQTLDLLVVTPVTALAIVIGKLLSALTYLLILIAASIPLTAVVFTFGGVGPEDVVRGYLVLVVSALGLGAIGLFCSALVRRTQAATMISLLVALTLTIGSIVALGFWGAKANDLDQNGVVVGWGPIHGKPPEILAYFNPFLAQADVACGTEATYGEWCRSLDGLLGTQSGIIVVPGKGPIPAPLPAPAIKEGAIGPGIVIDRGIAPDVAQGQQFGVAHDTFWPRSLAAWLVGSLVLVGLTVQLVSPTRRWRLRRRRDRSPASDPQ